MPKASKSKIKKKQTTSKTNEMTKPGHIQVQDWGLVRPAITLGSIDIAKVMPNNPALVSLKFR